MLRFVPLGQELTVAGMAQTSGCLDVLPLPACMCSALGQNSHAEAAK